LFKEKGYRVTGYGFVLIRNPMYSKTLKIQIQI